MRDDEAGTSRRAVLAGIGCAALAAALAGCSTNGGSESDAPAPAPPEGGPLAKVADIPVGGGKVVADPNGLPIVIVQPTTGDIKAYSAVCTHQGTTVGPPEADGIMTCPNHGSRFRAADGSVVNGPAGRPLEPVAVTVKGEEITLA
jgi:Rieske Fe-S protein